MATKIPFRYEFDYKYNESQQVTPFIRRVLAPNPSAFTFRGTGTYIVGQGNVAVIDPGPVIPEHIDALKQALGGERVTHILITHTHMDHSPAAAPLKEYWNAPTYGYGPHGAGKIEQGVQVEEGGDMDFEPDVKVRHGDVIEGDGWTMKCVFTPGHTSNHMCFALEEEKTLFSGDHVMGWSTSVISPPDGDMTDYMNSLELLLVRNDRIYWPTHGPAIENPHEHVQAFIEHRLEREQQIIECLRQGVTNIADMVPLMYKDVDENLYPAASRSVLAAMLRLIDTGRVDCDGEPSASAEFALIG